MPTQERLLACWGKLDLSNGAFGYHPLLCHMVDVSMVAKEMWESSFSTAQQEAIAEPWASENALTQRAAGALFLPDYTTWARGLPRSSCRWKAHVWGLRNDSAAMICGFPSSTGAASSPPPTGPLPPPPCRKY